MFKNYTLLLIVLGLTVGASSCTEKVQSPIAVSPLFDDHMVLQQNENVAFWGTSQPGTQIHIKADWGKETVVTSDNQGEWTTQLETPAAGGPYTIEISSSETNHILNDVMIGEVWLASGQSNMEMPLTGYLPNEPLDNYQQEIAKATFPNIRFINIVKHISAKPTNEFSGKWEVTSPETGERFSATAYFFARKLSQELKVPIGIINTSWGGTPVESWISKEKLVDLDEFENELATLDEAKIAEYDGWYNKFEKSPIPTTDTAWSALDLGDTNFKNEDFVTADWKTIDLPAMVENFIKPSADGAFWFRKEFNIDEPTEHLIFQVEQGIDDSDYTFVNGQKIGETHCYNCPRNYTIPANFLRKGKNTIAIRLVDTGGGGGFSGDVSLSNQKGEQIEITKNWKYAQIADVKLGQFILYHKNPELYNNPPAGIDSFNMTAGTPSVLYNGMINPILPYTIRGAIWYQGESNVGRDAQYLKLFPGMITDWREKWDYDFPFYFVQIAPWHYGSEGQSPALRDAQRKSLNVSNTGMAVTLDIGNEQSIHPGNKTDVGERLALLALDNDYKKEIVSSGPLYEKSETKGNQLTLSFTNVGDGLVSKTKTPEGFEIAGEDKQYYPAQATIVGNQIMLSSSKIKQPKYARYGWKDYFEATLFNKNGLPASSFSTEE